MRSQKGILSLMMRISSEHMLPHRGCHRLEQLEHGDAAGLFVAVDGAEGGHGRAAVRHEVRHMRTEIEAKK